MRNLYPDYEHSTKVPPTFYRRDLSDWTTNEVNALIFHDASPSEHRAMPQWVAEQVIKHDHFDQRLKDWAWQTVLNAMENGV